MTMCFNNILTILLTLSRGRKHITIENKLGIFKLLLGGYTKSKVAKTLGISKELVHYHVNTMEREKWVERVNGSKNPILYKRGNNPYPDLLSIKLDRGYVSENMEQSSANNFNPVSTGNTPQIPSLDNIVKNWKHTSVESFHIECRIHNIKIGIPITHFEGDIASLPFLDSKSINLAHNVKKYTGILEFNLEESYPIWIFSDKKLIIHLPTETVFNAHQLRDWYKRAFRYIESICKNLSRNHGFEFGEPYISKVHFAFPDQKDLMRLNKELQISTPDCWTDSSKGKVEFETNKMEIALAFFEMPLRIMKLEKEIEELKKK
jgi:hypothetical protein